MPVSAAPRRTQPRRPGADGPDRSGLRRRPRSARSPDRTSIRRRGRRRWRGDLRSAHALGPSTSRRLGCRRAGPTRASSRGRWRPSSPTAGGCRSHVQSVETDAPLPAEEHVDRRLGEALAPYDAFAMVLEHARTQVGLQPRRLRLLHLQHQRVSPIPAGEQEYPCACTDAPDADDLARHVDEAVGPQKMAAVLVEAGGVGVKRLAHDVGVLATSSGSAGSLSGTNSGGTRAETQFATDALGELRNRPQAGLAPRLGKRPRRTGSGPSCPAVRRTGPPVRSR